MPIIVGREGVHGDVYHELARLEQLAADLDLIANGELPSADRLSSAPLLDAWRADFRPVPCLVGTCTDHPRLRGPLIFTTDVWAIAPDFGWARTLSRFYRLGEPSRGGGVR
jgi:hypothetical protein